MIRATLILCAAALLAAMSALAAGEPAEYQATGEWKSIDVKDRVNPPPFEPVRREISLSTEKPEGYGELPEGLVEPVYGTVEFLGRGYRLVLAKGKADAVARDVLLFDVDGDDKFGDGERFEVNVQAQGGVKQGSVIEDLAVKSGERTFPFVCAYLDRPGQPIMAQAIALWFLAAKFKAGEKELVAYGFDGNGDGAFTSEEDGWILRAADAGPQRPAGPFAVYAFTEGIFLDGAIYRAQLGEGTALKVTAQPAAAADPADLESRRGRVEKTWFKLFDAEKAEFVKARGFDTSRPLAEKPIAWNYVTFDQGLALAKEQGKPLFVDVMAFWCVWCYRMDYYTYPDQEVAALLSGKFVPVKIIQEQDADGSYDKVMGILQAEGIPAMGVFGGDGALVAPINGWNAPKDFCALLTDALSKLPK